MTAFIPPQIGIDDRHTADDEDGCGIAPAGERDQNDRGGVKTEAVGQTPGDEEQTCRRAANRFAEPIGQDLIDCQQLAAKEKRDEQDADQDPPDHVSAHQLHESEIAALAIGAFHEGVSGDADERHRTGLGRHDGESNSPPGNRPPADEIVPGRALTASEKDAEQRRSHEIKRDDPNVSGMKSHQRIRPRRGAGPDSYRAAE